MLLGTVVDFSSALWNTVADPYKAYQAKPGNGAQGYGNLDAASRSIGRGMGKAGGSLTKAILVDVPLALADGLHAVPSLYGEKVRDRGAVTDWKSGGAVAGKVPVAIASFCALACD